MNLDEFGNLLPGEIAKHVPKSMIFAAGGTRRAARLAGIHDQDEYARWSSGQLIESFGLFAKYGVKHILTHAIVPTQWMEVTPEYRENLIAWVGGILTSEETVAEFQRRGWRACLIGAEFIPELKPAADTLSTLFPRKDYHFTVYYIVTPYYDSHWKDLFSIFESGLSTQSELIFAQYHEEIPPIKLYIGYGKPSMSAAVCPPALGAFDGMHCYWLQKPGFVTNESSVLSILYDYAFTRKTWQRDKSDRTEKVLEFRTEISQENILGVGKRLGPFWYPEYKMSEKND
jgi:hypothetical protein